MKYELRPDLSFPHRFTIETQGEFDYAVEWCYEAFGEDMSNERWDYAWPRLIRITRPDDALRFWMRFAHGDV
jgi:hypothetical protein